MSNRLGADEMCILRCSRVWTLDIQTFVKRHEQWYKPLPTRKQSQGDYQNITFSPQYQKESIVGCQERVGRVLRGER